jgi:hypothetical protein
MRSLRLMGSDDIPAVLVIGDELRLTRSFEVDMKTDEPVVDPPDRASAHAGDG